MFRFMFAFCLGAATLYGYQHYTAKDVKKIEQKTEKVWHDTAPIRDKAGRAAGAAYEQLKK